MSSLSQEHSNPYLNQLNFTFTSHIRNVASPHNQTFSISNYSETIELLCSQFQELCRNTLKNSLERIDEEYKNSELRKRDYYVHNRRERTIITVFGVVRFFRTIYKDKTTGKTFTYLDRKLDFPRWDKYDPCIKAMVYELYADQNSMLKVGSIIGDRIYSPFSSSNVRHQFKLSRQTVHNIVRKSLLTKLTHQPVKQTPREIFIIADEKWVHLQREGKEAMVKAAVIFEDIVHIGGRNELVNKIVHISNDSHFWEDVYDIVTQKYDIDSIKNISILGDGAGWIKQGVRIFPKATFTLDKFHYKQALNRITVDKTTKQIMHSNILGKNKETFIDICRTLTEVTDKSSRKSTIEMNRNYIVNNWKSIQLAYLPESVGCSMESAISHMLASIFTNRPKAYSRKKLRTYLNMRCLHLNNIDLRKHYLQTLSVPRTSDYYEVKESLDFSIFEPRNAYDKSSQSRWVKGFISRI